MKTTTTTFYKEILNQLGGNKFLAMTGSYALSYSEKENYLQMRLRRNKASATFLKVTLNSLDLYDMTFTRLRNNKLINVKTFENVYCDQLQDIFTDVTGLRTSL